MKLLILILILCVSISYSAVHISESNALESFSLDKDKESIVALNQNHYQLSDNSISLQKLDNDNFSAHGFVQQYIKSVSYDDFLDNEAGIYSCIKRSIFSAITNLVEVEDNVIDLVIIPPDAITIEIDLSNLTIFRPLPSVNNSLSIEYHVIASDVFKFTSIISDVTGSVLQMNDYMRQNYFLFGADALFNASFQTPLVFNLPPANPSSSPVNYPSRAPIPDPTFEPTTNPTFFPSYDPTAEPTQYPSLQPSARPTPTSAPNSRDFTFIDITQVISGVGYNDYLSTPYLYTLGITSAASDCILNALDLPSSQLNIIAFLVRTTSSITAPSSSSTLSLIYTVSVQGGYTVDAIGSTLQNCTAKGIFDEHLHDFADLNQLDSLKEASSSSLSYSESKSLISSDSTKTALSTAALAVIIVLSVILIPVLFFSAYHYYFKQLNAKARGGLSLPVEPNDGELNSLFYRDYEASDVLGDTPLDNPMNDASAHSFGLRMKSPYTTIPGDSPPKGVKIGNGSTHQKDGDGGVEMRGSRHGKILEENSSHSNNSDGILLTTDPVRSET